MKLLTTNFLTCAVKACKSSPASFPLHFRDATLERNEIAYNPSFISNILPRLNWDALITTANELGLEKMMPESNPVDAPGWFVKTETEGMNEREAEQMEVEVETQDEQKKDETLQKLHKLLLETGVVEGKLVCENCGYEYPIKDGVGNFLLPPHLV